MEPTMAPPLPPKTRRSPPASATVLHSPGEDVFSVYPAIGDSQQSNVVKIRINPIREHAPCIRISVNNPDLVDTMVEDSFFYNCALMSSGQVSPSDTLDSGTCSDLEASPPPKKGISVTLIQHKRASSLASSADSDDNESSVSCDSLTSLPQDIRTKPEDLIKSYAERQEEQKVPISAPFDTDMFYEFHMNEHISEPAPLKPVVEDETFAGYKDLLGDGAATIRSAKGTVRGVKNRVRAGIATFLQINSVNNSYKEKESGKVVVYTTTVGIQRETYQACMKVKQILRTLLIKFEERDLFMSAEYQDEIRERMHCSDVLVPQVFVNGQHVGDADSIERLNESGELRRILKPFKSMDVCTTCQVCGGYRMLPCQVCNGSKKSVHRNHFTSEFVALKCMNCDEVGLVKCTAC